MPAARTPVGIGIVGAGMVGQMCHLANFTENPGCRVVALAELRPELGRRVAERFSVPRLYATHHELLADPQVDAVAVVTRRAATGPIVLDALGAGRHVLSEKPMAHTVEQASRLAAKAAERGRTYAIGYMKRHDAGIVRAKARVDELLGGGALGRLLSARSWCLGGNTGPIEGRFEMTDEPRPEGLELWPSAPAWLPAPLTAEYDWFLNVHIHMINLLRHFLGRTPEVNQARVADRTAGEVRLDFAGAPVTMEIGEVVSETWHEGLEFTFERGALRVDLPPPFLHDAAARVVLQRQGAEPEAFAPLGEPGWAFRRQADAFVADVAAGRQSAASGADAVDDLRVAEAIWRANDAPVGA